VFLEIQASAILGHYLPLPPTLPASRPAIETAWYSMLVAPSELSTLQWLGQKRLSPGISHLVCSDGECPGRLSVQMFWEEVGLAAEKPPMNRSNPVKQGR
jgi:hypothetical protein